MRWLILIVLIGVCYVSVNFTLAKSREVIPINRAVTSEGSFHQLATQNQQSDGHSERLPGSTGFAATGPRRPWSSQTIAPAINYPPNYLLIWTADWCSKCPRMKTLGVKLKNEGFDIFYIDFDINKKQAIKDRITAVPVAVVYTASKEVKRFVGISQRTEARIEAQIRNVLRKNKCH